MTQIVDIRTLTAILFISLLIASGAGAQDALDADSAVASENVLLDAAVDGDLLGDLAADLKTLEEPMLEEPVKAEETVPAVDAGLEVMAVEEPAAVTEPAAAVGDLLLEEPMVVEEPAAVAEPAAAVGDLLLEEPMVVEEPAAAVEPAAVVEPAAAVGDLLLEEPMVVEEPAAAVKPVAVVEEPLLEEPLIAAEPAGKKAAVKTATADKDEPLDIDFDSLVKETRKDVSKPPVIDKTIVLPKTAEEPALEGNMAAVPGVDPDQNVSVEQVKSLAFTEDLAILQRRANEDHARGQLQDGNTAYNAGDYDRAIALYKDAYGKLGRRAETQKERALAKTGIGKAYYAKALNHYKLKELKEAEENVSLALDYGHPGALKLRDLIKNPPPPPPPAAAKREPVLEQAEIQTKHKRTSDLLWLGRQYFQAKQYDRSVEMFEAVLSREPQNTEAIRMLRKIGALRFDRATSELSATRESMIADLRETWNPRHYRDVDKALEDIQIGQSKLTTQDKNHQKIESKLQSIRVPEIDFHQANINDVIEFLAQASKEYDVSELEDGSIRGVNIVLKIGAGGGGGAGPAAAAVADDPFAVADAGAAPAAASGAGGDIPPVTFTAHNLTLMEALKLVCDYCNLKYRISGSVVMIVPIDEPDADIEHRWYTVMNFTDIMSTMKENAGAAGGGGGAAGDFIALDGNGVGGSAADADWKKFFQSLGVPWPQGSAIQYMSGIGKLMVANTADNLAKFEKIISQFDFVPKQIEIEARFVEVNQSDLESLGLEMKLTDDWDMLRRKSEAGLPLTAQQSIRMKAHGTADSFTVANRFLTQGVGDGGLPIADNIMKIAGVLTNPELEMILHMMSQNGNSDLLSAPKVTAQSGAEATIKVVEEYIYPTEFTVSGITGGQNAAGVGGGMTGAVVEPGGFETREVGVLLSVLPEVSPEGQMINLTLSPEVCEFRRWEEYGSTFTDAAGGIQQLRMPQPIFHTRQVTTSIMIFNGATVVMGGMITENRVSVNDKVPFLGDIPLLGRLFRSKYEKSEKRNLLIFVTAKLVRPDGREVLSAEKMNENLKAAAEAAKDS